MPQTLAAPHAASQSESVGGDHSHALERVGEALRSLRFGTVTVIVQDGVVVQVERTEKLRLLRRAPHT